MAKKKQLSSDQYFDLCQHIKGMSSMEQPVAASELSARLEKELKMPVSPSAVKRAVDKVGRSELLLTNGATVLELKHRIDELEKVLNHVISDVVLIKRRVTK